MLGFGPDHRKPGFLPAIAADLHGALQRRLEPSSTSSDLSPSQLANFYRSCGGNYDELFKNTGEHGVSWIYRTLGCYHSLQPSKNAFEAPSIPCLTDDGYVRWQTLQLLLCPEEHVTFMQKAVELYDVPRKGGGSFPKTIPTQCFPVRPDPDMEKWHRFVTSQINQDYMRRIKFSPYASPNPESGTSPGGYFARAPTRPPHGQRRESLSEEELARREAMRRRRSVPDVTSPGGTPLLDKATAEKVRSRSAARPVTHSGHVRQRSDTGAHSPYQTSPLPPRPTGSNTSIEHSKRRRDPRHERNISSGPKPDSADDASSEESYPARKHKSSEEEDNRKRSRWGTSLMPSFFLSKQQRRHSSDGRVPTLNSNKRSPRRSESIRKYNTESQVDPRGRRMNNVNERSPSGVRFNDAFNHSDHQPRPDEAYAPPPSSYRYSEPHPNAFPPPPPNPTVKSNLNSNPLKPNVPNVNYIPPTPPNGQPTPTHNYFAAHPPLHNARADGVPLRVSTYHGVNGRRYPPAETQSALEPTSRRRDRTSSMRNPATSTVL